MNYKNKLLFVLILTTIFSSSLIFIPTINNSDKSSTDQKSTSNQLIKEEPINEEPINLEQLKTADLSEEQQNHNFTLNAFIQESWNQNFHFPVINSTKPDNSQTDWMILQNTEGITINSFYFVMYDLMNLTSMEKVYPSNFTTMYLSYLNESLDRERLSVVSNHPFGEGLGQVNYLTPPLKINKTKNAQFVIWNDWVEYTNISFGALMFIDAYQEYNLTAKFVPTQENTLSNMITWELNYDGHINQMTNGNDQNYDASIKIEEFDNFTVNEVLGFDGNYWLPLNYSRNETHISINYALVNNSIAEFKIQLQTPNYLSIVFNNNLTSAKPELRLYATCKIAGNLSIRFKLTNGTIFEESWLVQENQTKVYNYIMPLNATGGVGSLNVTLTDNSRSKFGVKIQDVYFHKNAYFQGYTSNTSAFAQFFVAVGYIDWDTLMYLYAVNASSPSINWTGGQIQDMATIPNATITYELEDLTGELDLSFLGGYGAPNISAYWKLLDLSEYQIPPGTYNLTFTASKPGYDSLVSIVPIVISEKSVYIEIILVEDVLTIEEEFVISFNLYDGETGQNFLMTPVTLNLTFINNDTKLIDEFFPIFPVIQSTSLPAIITNDTIPGTYILNITIDSEYYYGSIERFIKVEKKELDLSLDFISTIEGYEEIKINWSLENDNFAGNWENMSLNFYLDGKLYNVTRLNDTLQSSGLTNFTTLVGDHDIKYELVSPFYCVNESDTFSVIKKELNLTIDYDITIIANELTNITWTLESGAFTGNRENMTLEILIDGELFIAFNLTSNSTGYTLVKLSKGTHSITYRLVSPYYYAEETFNILSQVPIVSSDGGSGDDKKVTTEDNWMLILFLIGIIITVSVLGTYMAISRRKVRAQRELESELIALKTKFAATENNLALIQTQISEIAGIYWILVIHSEQGTTMVEITEFKFNEVLGEEFKVFVEEGMIRDSALIGGFLTAIRNFSRETSGESHEYQPIFNSQTDYSTVANDKEVHRRILEGSSYFMAFISARGTMEISEVLSAVNSKFHEGYGEAAKEFLGKVSVFNPFKEEVATYLQNEIRELQKKLEEEILLRQHYERHLKQVQEKIGIKKIK